MKKIYFLSTSNIPENWSETFNDIVKVDPDEVIIVSNTEVYIDGNWGSLFKILNPWLEQTNKFAHIVTPHLPTQFLASRIITEQSYAMVESVIPLYKDKHYDQLVWDRVYCSYMFRPSESRGRLLDTLVANDLLKDGYVTYHNTSVETHPGFAYHNKSPILFNEESYSKDVLSHFTDPHLYRNSFIDVVAEASYQPYHCFLTEKTIRAVCHEKPFITVGSPSFHKKYLRDLFGFKLYDEIIDYSFDSKICLQERINGVVENLKNIISNKDKLDSYYETLLPKLKHNKKRLLDIYNDPNKIIPKCLQQLLDPNFEYIKYGHNPSILHLTEKYRNQNGKLS